MTDLRHDIYHDRLSDRPAPKIPMSGMLIGRWTLATIGQSVLINSASTNPGDFLVTEPSGNWRILTEDGQQDSGKAFHDQIPIAIEADSVRTIGDKLNNLLNEGASWDAWIKTVPLVPEFSEQVDLHHFECLVRKNYGHFESVCRKPRAHLHVDVKRIPVSKAQRIPSTAVSYLASHSEDWDRRLIRGILPKRILAEIKTDQLDIYENRVTARLIDKINLYLNDRIKVLRRAIKLFQEKQDFSSFLGGTYQREIRVSKLWGESLDANEGLNKAKYTLIELEQLRYKILGLLSTPLYINVPRRANVQKTLKNTNILSNEPHYQRIAELWRENANIGGSQPQTPSELYSHAQRLCKGLNSFAMLLTVRALDMLGFKPPHEKNIAPGKSFQLLGQGIELNLTWQKNGAILIGFGPRELAIIALASNLRTGTNDQVREGLNQIQQGVNQRERGNVLILYLSSENDRAVADPEILLSTHTAGNNPLNVLKECGCLPVSPWEIGSSERVARAIRWFISSSLFCKFPIQIKVSSGLYNIIDLAAHSKWLRLREELNILEIHRPPLNYEWEQLNIPRILENMWSNLQQAKVESEDLYNETRNAVRKGKTGSLVRQKHDAKAKEQKCENDLKAAIELTTALGKSHEILATLLNCPSCQKSADPSINFKRLDHGCFRCSCSDCGTIWETRICRDGHRFPTMLPSGKFQDTDDQSPGWEDRVYGCDILALPARKKDGQWGFMCPTCGQVT